MELAELLASEGLDPDELMAWARQRSDGLLAELDADDELLTLLESDAALDLESIELPARARRAGPSSGVPRGHDDDDDTNVMDLPVAAGSDLDPEDDVSAGAHPREPSTPQPTSADELPPVPEHSGLADGEPEPMLETVDTGPIDLGTPEANALIAAHSTRELPTVEAEPSARDDAPAEASGELEELEFDELEELDDEELELLEEVEDGESSSSPPPPPPPPASGPPPLDAAADAATEGMGPGDTMERAIVDPAVEDMPVRSGDTAVTAAPTDDDDDDDDQAATESFEIDMDFD